MQNPPHLPLFTFVGVDQMLYLATIRFIFEYLIFMKLESLEQKRKDFIPFLQRMFNRPTLLVSSTKFSFLLRRLVLLCFAG
jgi:hypothetical protein